MSVQLLSRVRTVEARGAELLRILYRSPPGFGEKVTARRVLDELDKRRALDLELPHDRISDGEDILTRPSLSSAAAVRKSVGVLLAMRLVTRRSKGVYVITEAGRKECELWYPELLRAAANSREMAEWTPPHGSDTVDT